jgi:hypothetical protein
MLRSRQRNNRARRHIILILPVNRRPSLPIREGQDQIDGMDFVANISADRCPSRPIGCTGRSRGLCETRRSWWRLGWGSISYCGLAGWMAFWGLCP